MSQKKIDYSKSFIYKLCCKNPTIEEIYIGSTTNKKTRKGTHKSDCKNINKKSYNNYKYQFIRDNGGFENWDMIMIEEYSCNSKNELEKRERYWCDELKPILNSIRPQVTIEENKIRVKKNYQKFKKSLENNEDKKKKKLMKKLINE